MTIDVATACDTRACCTAAIACILAALLLVEPSPGAAGAGAGAARLRRGFWSRFGGQGGTSSRGSCLALARRRRSFLYCKLQCVQLMHRWHAVLAIVVGPLRNPGGLVELESLRLAMADAAAAFAPAH